MLEQFRNFIESRSLISPGARILLAVSGGIDSMVMLHLFGRLGIGFSVAHCNFQLRGRDSDDDEAFVRNQCEQLRVPFYSRKFNTEKTATREKISVQMAARELRYAFFRKLITRNGYTRVATAHNLNDMAETVLLNLVRGTGSAGMHGIVARNGPLIRPLLFASRDRIKDYSSKEKIKWREDKTNASDRYARNKVRLKVMPVLEAINPSVLEAIRLHCEAMADTEALFREYVQLLKEKLITRKGQILRIDIDGLLKHHGAATLLFELMREYGFNRTSAADVFRSLGKAPGRVFLAPAYRMVKDRKYLMLHKLTPGQGEEYAIGLDKHDFRWDPGTISLRKLALTLDLKKSILEGKLGDRHIAWLDAGKLQFPLILRKWKAGDTFHPLGMRGRKKLSDFFTDNKYPLVRKESTWLLLSGGKIAWIVGDRIDDRFRITAKSVNCLEVLFESA